MVKNTVPSGLMKMHPKKLKGFRSWMISAILILLLPSLSAQIDQTKEDQLGLKSGADPTNISPEDAGKTRKGKKPVVFIIGDSTVKNGRGDGKNGQWGWGSFFWQFTDTARVSIENHAIGGRSSRTFIEEGRWQKVLDALQPGDYVIVQFGHNDAGPLNTGRARATLKGNGNNDTTVVMEATGKENTIHSFGWYMRKYAKETLEKGATPVLLSHIPRNMFTAKDSLHLIRNTKGFGAWTMEASDQVKGSVYIDLNNEISDKLEALGKEKIQTMYFGDHTHTSYDGAMLNAETMADLIKHNKKLKKLSKTIR